MTEKTDPTSTTMLYRAGDSRNLEAWNRKLDTLIVADDGVKDAQADGWLLAADLPEDDDAPAKATKAKPAAEKA